ncbi:MAG: 50S ribosomal protein L35 [Candidatus Kappaea frigidicola]|nr:50S ribosomal protein L35 [Candidatus Kappaea frigidicola]
MPKLKTNKGTAKRFKVTKNGKIKRNKAGSSHILSKKTRKRKRSLRRGAMVDQKDEKRLKQLLPYS